MRLDPLLKSPIVSCSLSPYPKLKSLTKSLLIAFLALCPLVFCQAQEESVGTIAPDSNSTENASNTTSGQVQEATKDGTQSLEEALDKKPGINFSSVQIGGQSSGINLSSIRADSVESLEALKLATPDMDADIVGGTLNLKFRPAFAQRSPTRQVRAYITQYELAEKPGVSLYLTDGRSFREENRWGYLLNARAYQSFIAEENLYRDWELKKKSEWPDIWRFQDVQIEKEDFRSRSVSANILLDYELSKELRIFTRGIFANTNRQEVNRGMEYEWDDGDFVSLDEDSATVEGMSLFKGIEERRNERKTREVTAGLQYKGDLWRWEAQAKYDLSDSQYPHRWDSFFEMKNVDASYDEAMSDYPIFTIHPNSQERATDTANYLFDEVRIYKSKDIYLDKIASFDLERFFIHEKGSLKIKSGLKFLNRDLDSGDDIRVFDKAAGELTIAQFESPWRNDDIHYWNYSLSGFHDPVAFREYFLTHPDDFTLNETRTRSQSDPANYTVNETISSAYLMGDYLWNTWRILAGIRMEKTEDEFTGKEVLFDETGAYTQTLDTEGGREYTDYFPGIQAVYTASNQLTLYTSWSKAIERPRYYYLAPFRRINQRSQYVSAGNSELKPTVFTSLLAAADWAYHDSGFLSLELLRRDNEDIVVQSQTTVPDGQFKDYDLYTWENAGFGIHNQAQVIWNQGLDPLWFNLEGFSLEMRYRYNETETDIRGPEFDTTPITAIPENDVRTSFIYQNDHWLLRLRADHRSDMLRRIGANPDKDTYYYAKTTYTFSVEYRAENGWVGNVGVYNLNQEDSFSYFGDPGRPADLASRGRYWRGSVRYTF